MSASIPDDVRRRIKAQLWSKADDLNWTRLSDLERAKWYEGWAKDPHTGGVLSHFMDPRKVRVYIKDALLKPYRRARMEDSVHRVLSAIGADRQATTPSATFLQPHGLMLQDGRVVCWGSLRDWKAVVIAVFERARQHPQATPYAAVLIQAGRSPDDNTRQIAEEIAERLGIARLEWIE